MQRMSLIELEMEGREIPVKPLQDWHEAEALKFDEQGFFNE